MKKTKMARTIFKAVFAVFFLVLAVYFGFQIYNVVYPAYRTETAVLYSVTDSVPCAGIAVRNESVVAFDSEGTLSFRVNNGDKVAAESVVADVYSSKSIASSVKIREVLLGEMTALENASDVGRYAGANLDSMSDRIYQIMAGLSASVNTSAFDDFEKNRLLALEQISVFASSAGSDIDYDSAVSGLSAEIGAIDAEMSADGDEIRTSEGGYFVSFTDGFEHLCFRDGELYESRSQAESEGSVPLSPSEIGDILISGHAEPDGNSCKIISDYEWLFAALVGRESERRFYVGQSLTLKLDYALVEELPVTVSDIVSDTQSDRIMILFSCEYLNSDIVGIRIEEGEISFRNYRGVRIPRSAIRVVNGETGVYTKYDNRVVFKRIRYDFETDEYVLAIPSENDGDLKLYDEIILEGRNIQDGKTL